MPSFSIKQGQPSLLQGIALGGAQGIATGLQQLAADRLASIRQQQEQTKLAQTLKSLNLSPQEQGDVLHLLPPEQRLNALSALASLSPQQQQQQFLAAQPKPIEQEPTLFAAAQEERARELIPQQPPISPQQLAQESLRLQAGLPTELNLKDVLNEYKDLGLQRPSQDKIRELKQAVEQYNANPEQFAQNNQPTQPQNIPQQQALALTPAPQQPVQPQVSRFAKPLTPMERIAEKTFQLKLSKDERENYEKLKPVLEEQRKDFNNSLELYKFAKRALDNIEKNKDKWPTISGYLPTQLQRDPDIRNYTRDINNIVNIKANAMRGNPTNFKTKLIQESKVNLTEPVESQIQGLKDIIADTKDVFNTQDRINEIQKEHGDKLPFDLAQKLINKIGRPDQQQSQRPIEAGARLSQIDKSQLPIGYPLSKNGVKYIWDGNKPVLASEFKGVQ